MSIYRTNNPMEYDQVDGIVIDERAPEPGIRGVGTGVAILVGQFNQGPINELVEPGSQARIVEMFGKEGPGYQALRNKRFSRLRIVRVNQSGGAMATLTVQDDGPTDLFTLTAKQVGVEGNMIAATIADSDRGGAGAAAFKLTITMGEEAEVYDVDTVAALKAEIDASSLLVTIAVAAEGEPVRAVGTNLAGGANGASSDADYQAAINVAAVENAGNVLFLDEYNEIRNGYLKAHAATTQDKMVICAGAVNETVLEAVAAVTNLRDTDGRIIYAYNWLGTSVDGANIFVNPASFLASILSQTGAHIDPAFAQNSGLLYGVNAVRNQLTRADFIQLVQAGIASFQFDPDIGYTLKSGVTTQVADTAKVTIVRRRMADFLTNSIGRALKIYGNAINSEENRVAVKGAILDFIRRQEELGVLPRDAEVQNGRASEVDIVTLNTNESIGAGQFLINYRQRIFSSMRYIVLIAEIGETVQVREGE